MSVSNGQPDYADKISTEPQALGDVGNPPRKSRRCDWHNPEATKARHRILAACGAFLGSTQAWLETTAHSGA